MILFACHIDPAQYGYWTEITNKDSSVTTILFGNRAVIKQAQCAISATNVFNFQIGALAAKCRLLLQSWNGTAHYLW